ncbi:hypothetical protein BC628DRAFT_23841 [Trametes gibbosa]|nr:hypothetical protein BC628DRAFT_23841 [Trametes gibbosa]
MTVRPDSDGLASASTRSNRPLTYDGDAMLRAGEPAMDEQSHVCAGDSALSAKRGRGQRRCRRRPRRYPRDRHAGDLLRYSLVTLYSAKRACWKPLAALVHRPTSEFLSLPRRQRPPFQPCHRPYTLTGIRTTRKCARVRHAWRAQTYQQLLGVCACRVADIGADLPTSRSSAGRVQQECRHRVSQLQVLVHDLHARSGAPVSRRAPGGTKCEREWQGERSLIIQLL